jgi:DNA polymerase I-like protein with 3'-5' exonuclease and polymerase domains
MFCTLQQDPESHRITWSEPAEYIESLFGFRRYFTLENQLAKELFELAQKVPSTWRKLTVRVHRSKHKGEQTAAGATQSALFGAAFSVQNSSKRAAGNHEIQSSGATITKAVQRKVWDFQPSGVGEWKVIPINVHDEIMCPTVPELVDSVKATVDATVESFRPRVPLIKMVWATHLESWAEK